MWILIFLLAAGMAAQTYTTDINGRRVELPTGKEVRERKVLEQGPNGTVYEEIIRKVDSQGNALAPEKLRVVERSGADGGKVVETTTYRGDVNGRFTPVERDVAETRKDGGKEVTNRSIYRPDTNGRLVEMVRQSVERAPDEKGRPKETLLEYQNASTGKLELSQQQVTVELKNPDGTSTSEITIYGMAVPGRPSDGTLKLREQQLITRQPGPNNTVKESFSVRRPGVTDGEKLGDFQKVSERIYKEDKKP